MTGIEEDWVEPYRRGLAALTAGNQLAHALSAFREALALSPSNAEVLLRYAIAQRGNRQTSLSADVCARALVIHPTWSEAHYHLGRALNMLGRDREAIMAFHSAAVAQLFSDAQPSLMHLPMEIDRKAGLAITRVWLVTDPGNPDIWFRFAQLLEATGDDQATLDAVRKASLLSPQNYDVNEFLTYRLLRLGRCEDGAQTARRGSVLAPDHNGAWLAASWVASGASRHAEALVLINRALIIDPHSVGAWNCHVYQLFRLGRFVDAIEVGLTVLEAPFCQGQGASLYWVLGQCCSVDIPDLGALLNRFGITTTEACALPPTDGQRLKSISNRHRAAGLRPENIFLRALICRQLGLAGWRMADLTEVGLLAADDIALFLSDTTLPVSSRESILPALGFSRMSPRDWNDWIFETFLLPGIASALDRAEVDLARNLVKAAHASLIVQPNTFEQAESCYHRLAPLFRSFLHRLEPSRHEQKGGHGRGVAFFMDSVDFNPPFHLERITHFLLSHRGEWEERLGPFTLVSMHEVSPAFRAQYRAIGVDILTPVDVPAMAGRDRLLDMIFAVRQRSPAIVVFFHIPEGMVDFLAGLRLAPTQVLLSAGFFHDASPDLDAFLTFGSGADTERYFQGRKWRCSPLPMLDSGPPPGSMEELELERQATEIRRRLTNGGGVLLGTIARPEKLSPEFLAALATILRNNPNVRYLWFGRNELLDVRNAMEDLGISEMCLFQGWVSSPLYARVLDIHLDSFPFPTGLTMIDSMCAGRAQVWMQSEESRQLGPCGGIQRLLLGHSGTAAEQAECREIYGIGGDEQRFLFAASVEEYCGFVQGLIDDHAYQKRVGHAGRRYAERFLTNQQRTANAFFTELDSARVGRRV